MSLKKIHKSEWAAPNFVQPNICTTILPWGKYRYIRLPMGIKVAVDTFQAMKAYLDGISITSSGSYEDHMQKFNTVLERLNNAGF